MYSVNLKHTHEGQNASFNHSHPNISINTLHTVVFSFLKVLTREFVWYSLASYFWDQVRYSHDLYICLKGVTIRRN